MLGRRLVTASVLVTALTACGSGSDDPGGRSQPAPSSPSTGSPTATTVDAVRRSADLGHDPAARRAVKTAVNGLLAAGTGSYSVTGEFEGAGSYDDAGAYDLGSRSWDLERTMSQGGDDLKVQIVSVGDTSWLKVKEWPCWASTQEVSAAGGAGAPPQSPAPAAVIAASWAIGREPGPGGFVGTTDLVTATQLLSNKLVSTGTLDPESTATVPADFAVTQGTLMTLTIRFADLFTALLDAGVADLGLDAQQAAAAPGRIEVRFADVGQPVTVTEPPADEILTSFDQSSFEGDMEACGRS